MEIGDLIGDENSEYGEISKEKEGDMQEFMWRLNWENSR
jgi:hypothetical protein